MTNTTPQKNSYELPETVDTFFKYGFRSEGQVKGVLEAVEEFRLKKGVSSKYEHLLDVGCGSGNTTVEFLKYFPRVTGIDASEGQIRKANEAHCDAGDRLKFLEAPAEKMPVQPSSVDVIVSIFALLNFELDEFLKECHRVLNPAGVILLVGATPVNFVPKTESATTSPHGKQIVMKMINDLKQYAEEIPHAQWHVFDRNYKLYQQIRGFKKSRDDFKEYDADMSLKGFKELKYSISFYSLPKSRGIIEKCFDDLKKQWGLEHMPDDEIEVTVTSEMDIITLSKI